MGSIRSAGTSEWITPMCVFDTFDPREDHLPMPSDSQMEGMGHPFPEASPSVAFRTVSPDDLDLLALMNAELLEHELGSAPPVERLREQLASAIAQGSRALIVQVGGLPAGYALYFESEEVLILRHFLIRSPWRRIGMGSSFLRHLESLMESPKPIQVEALLSNGAGLEFWRSQGFADFYLGLRKNPDPSVSGHIVP